MQLSRLMLTLIGALLTIGGATAGWAISVAGALGSLEARMELMENGISTPMAKDTVEAFKQLLIRLDAHERAQEAGIIALQTLSARVTAIGDRLSRLEGRSGITKQSLDESKRRNETPKEDSDRETLPAWEPLTPFVPGRTGG